MNFFIRTFAQVTQGIDGLYVAGEDLEHEIVRLSFRTVAISAVALIVMTLLAALLKDHAPKLKLPLFLGMAFTMAFSFLFLAGSTVYLNVKSDSGGPVHWHADIEYWACGNQLELRNPTGTLSNKIGTSTLHEHDDQRIHLEGVVVDGIKDASLGKFMYVIDGAITDEALVMPLDSEDSYFEDNIDIDGENAPNPQLIDSFIVREGEEVFFRALDGQNCGNEPADVQVFVYQYNEDDKTYKQVKLERPQDYIIRDDPNVPPGDCVIFEFDQTKPYTDKLCEQYSVRDIEACIESGIDPSSSSICEIRDVTDYAALDAAFTQQNQPDEAEQAQNEQSTETSTAEVCEPYYNQETGELLADIVASEPLTDQAGEIVEVEVLCAEYKQDIEASNAETQEAN